METAANAVLSQTDKNSRLYFDTNGNRASDKTRFPVSQQLVATTSFGRHLIAAKQQNVSRLLATDICGMARFSGRTEIEQTIRITLHRVRPIRTSLFSNKCSAIVALAVLVQHCYRCVEARQIKRTDL